MLSWQISVHSSSENYISSFFFFFNLLLSIFFPQLYKLGQTQGSKYSFLNLRFDDLTGKSSFIIFPF